MPVRATLAHLSLLALLQDHLLQRGKLRQEHVELGMLLDFGVLFPGLSGWHFSSKEQWRVLVYLEKGRGALPGKVW